LALPSFAEHALVNESGGERNDDEVVMRTTFLPLILTVLAFRAAGADKIPTELIGEWAPDQSKFDGGALSSGVAVYINTNGVAAIIQAPPPIAAKWRATYDATNRVLTLSIEARPSEGLTRSLTNSFIYDPKAMTLSPKDGSTKDVLKRRTDRIPKWVLE
jgi:hypothetical protein